MRRRFDHGMTGDGIITKVNVTPIIDVALVDEERVAVGSLTGVLQAHLAEPGNSDVLVVVRADSGAPYSDIRGLLEQTRAAGAKHIAIATRQKTEVSR